MTLRKSISAFILCPGLGHISRGYESFTRQCFDALSDNPNLNLDLYKGYGPTADHDHTLWCLRRSSRLRHVVNAVMDPHHDAYFLEQITFVLGLLPRIIRHQPQVIYYSDPAVGHALWHWRRLSGIRFRLLLSNGGPIGPPGFPKIDHVHQISPVYYSESAEAGRDAKSQTLLPYGFDLSEPDCISSRDNFDKGCLRVKLGLPIDRTIILSVGAINRSHKRMDYLIGELSTLPPPRPFLVILGAADDETASVVSAANALLGNRNFLCSTVSAQDVGDYVKAADIFVLASLKEGFSRALGEAYASGLPCLATDAPHARFVLGARGWYGKFSCDGELAALIARVLQSKIDPISRLNQRIDAFERLSWSRLAPSYVDMILRTAGPPSPG